MITVYSGAIADGRWSSLVQALLDGGADPSLAAAHGWNALNFAVEKADITHLRC